MLKVRLPYKLPEDLKKEVFDFAITTDTAFKYHGTNSKYGSIHQFINLTKLDIPISKKVRLFGDAVFDDMMFDDRLEEPYMGYAIMMVKDKGYVQPHYDHREPNTNYHHVTINFMVNKPIIGGDPIIEGITYNIEQSCGWFLIANLWKHACTTVEGASPRITLCLGTYVNPKCLSNFLEKKFNTEYYEQRTIQFNN